MHFSYISLWFFSVKTKWLWLSVSLIFFMMNRRYLYCRQSSWFFFVVLWTNKPRGLGEKRSFLSFKSGSQTSGNMGSKQLGGCDNGLCQPQEPTESIWSTYRSAKSRGGIKNRLNKSWVTQHFKQWHIELIETLCNSALRSPILFCWHLVHAFYYSKGLYLTPPSLMSH